MVGGYGRPRAGSAAERDARPGERPDSRPVYRRAAAAPAAGSSDHRMGWRAPAGRATVASAKPSVHSASACPRRPSRRSDASRQERCEDGRREPSTTQRGRCASRAARRDKRVVRRRPAARSAGVGHRPPGRRSTSRPPTAPRRAPARCRRRRCDEHDRRPEPTSASGTAASGAHMRAAPLAAGPQPQAAAGAIEQRAGLAVVPERRHGRRSRTGSRRANGRATPGRPAGRRAAASRRRDRPGTRSAATRSDGRPRAGRAPAGRPARGAAACAARRALLCPPRGACAASSRSRSSAAVGRRAGFCVQGPVRSCACSSAAAGRAGCGQRRRARGAAGRAGRTATWCGTGCCPQSASYSVSAAAQTSVAPVACSPRACSGAM